MDSRWRTWFVAQEIALRVGCLLVLHTTNLDLIPHFLNSGFEHSKSWAPLSVATPYAPTPQQKKQNLIGLFDLGLSILSWSLSLSPSLPRRFRIHWSFSRCYLPNIYLCFSIVYILFFGACFWGHIQQYSWFLALYLGNQSWQTWVARNPTWVGFMKASILPIYYCSLQCVLCCKCG